MEKIELTKEERNAIAALKRLEKRWPKSLWLFATGMSISIMRYPEDLKDMALPDGGMDPAYEVDSVTINNDGGDW